MRVPVHSKKRVKPSDYQFVIDGRIYAVTDLSREQLEVALCHAMDLMHEISERSGCISAIAERFLE